MLFKIFLRNLLKRNRNNWFGITGLSIGITVALVIGWWTFNEFSFDKFNRDYRHIYRLATQVELNGENIKMGSVFGPVMHDVKEEMPEVEDGTRCIMLNNYEGKTKMKTDGQVYYVTGIALCDTNFFKFFDYSFLTGHSNNCFNGPNSLVISKSFAIKYFGTTDVLGKSVTIWDNTWEITAVIKDVPSNSHLQFDAMACMQGFEYWDKMDWGNNDAFLTYFKLPLNADIPDLEKRITKLTYDKFWYQIKADIQQVLQPLSEIHFSEGYRFEQAKTANKSVVVMVMLMALAILVIACVNFTNLFISSALLRARAVGIRKTSGANRATLMMEFFLETTFHTLIAMAAGFIMAFFIMPWFNQLTGIEIAFDFSTPLFYFFLLIIALLTIILSGTFPAFYITKFNPVETLKGKLQGKGVSTLQKSLVVIQYAASIILMISVLTIKKQIHFFQDMDLGFNTSNVIYFNMTDSYAKSIDAVKNKLKSNPNIVDVTIKNGNPSEWRQGQGVASYDSPSNEHIMEICQVEDNYYPMLGIDLVDGEMFESNHDSINCALINQKAVKQLQLSDPVGKRILINGNAFTVKGVIEDIKNRSLHNSTDAQVYLKLSEPQGWHTLIVKTDGNNKAVIAQLQDIWNQICPDDLFEYHFLDSTYEQMYANDERTGKMVTIGMIIALLLTTLGMFALVKFTMQQRVKEIAVRKVNGATISGLVMNLNSSFLIWIILSFLVASPIAYFIMNHWLEGFAYRIHIGAGVFILGALLTLFVALSTVSWQTLAAARANPVKALKDE